MTDRADRENRGAVICRKYNIIRIKEKIFEPTIVKPTICSGPE
jgi:hypothetical protein